MIGCGNLHRSLARAAIVVVASCVAIVTWSARSAGAASREDQAGYGPNVKGLRAKVSLEKERFTVGEAITTHYDVRNVSPLELTVWHSGFWPNHQVLVNDADGHEPALTPLGAQTRKAFSPGGDRSKNAPLKIAPGESDDAEGRYNLCTLYDLSKPGRYTVQIVYEEKQGGWEGRLPSNVLAFEVVAKP